MYHVLSDSHLFLISLSFLFFFFFCGYICDCIFSFICLLCLELSPKSFSFQPDLNKCIEVSFFSPSISTSLPLLLPYLFPHNIITFSSAFLDVFLSHELSYPFFLAFSTLPWGRLNMDLGLSSLIVQNWIETTLNISGTNSVLTVLWHEDDWEQINSCLANLTSPKNSGSILPAGNWII